jgi:hypothetical protein
MSLVKDVEYFDFSMFEIESLENDKREVLSLSLSSGLAIRKMAG